MSAETEIQECLGLSLPDCVHHVWAVAIRLHGGRSHDAEDLVQEVFLRLTRRATTGALRNDEVANGLAYLRHMTMTVFVDLLRRRQTKKRGGDVAHVQLQEEHDTEARGAGPAQLLEDAAMNRALTDAILSLKPEHQSVMLPFITRGLSINEIAKLLSLPRQTVRSRLRSAQRAMRTYLRGSGWEVAS